MKMKVLIWACGFEQRFAGPYVATEAERQGFEMRVTGSRENPREMMAMLREYKPDIVFCFAIRPNFVPYYEAIRATGAKLVLWYPDMTERTRDRMWRRCLDGVADALIFSILETAQRYRDLAPTVLWMPQYFDHHFCFGPGRQPEEVGVFRIPQRLNPDERIYDLCFIGSCDRLRNAWLDKLEQEYGPDRCFFSRDGIRLGKQVRGPQMTEAYAQSKIAINITRQAFANPGPYVTSNRIYNAMGSGAFYLSHKVDKLGLVFREGVHCVTHDDTYEDAKAKIDHYLEHDDEREKIAHAGQQQVLEYHTLEQRIKEYWTVMQAIVDGRAGELAPGAFGKWVRA